MAAHVLVVAAHVLVAAAHVLVVAVGPALMSQGSVQKEASPAIARHPDAVARHPEHMTSIERPCLSQSAGTIGQDGPPVAAYDVVARQRTSQSCQHVTQSRHDGRQLRQHARSFGQSDVILAH
jgi:hypothetical protein